MKSSPSATPPGVPAVDGAAVVRGSGGPALPGHGGHGAHGAHPARTAHAVAAPERAAGVAADVAAGADAAAAAADAAAAAAADADAGWAPDVLEVALEAAPLAVWELDLHSRRMRASRGLAALLGLDVTPTAWSMADLEAALYPDDLPLFRAGLSSALQRGELRGELRLRGRDGRIRWLVVRGRVSRDAAGHPRRLVAAMHDVSERRASEDFRGDHASQWQAMFDATGVGMAQADPYTGGLLRVNARLCSMLSDAPERLIGRRFESLVHPDDRSGVVRGLDRLLRGEPPTLAHEIRMQCRGGGTVWVLLTVNLIRDAAGAPLRAALVCTDLSEQKRAQQALQHREAELREARRQLEDRVAERTMELAEANTALQVEIAERRLAEERVRELLGRQVKAVEEERSRIARELHDTLGQHLVALAIGLRAIGDDPSCPPPVVERVARVAQTLQHVEDELDRLSHELRPLALDDLGLLDALRGHVREWGCETGIEIDLHTGGLHTGRLPSLVETTVFRVVQEALTNVRKHAAARRVGVIVERRHEELRVVVEDDGRGFDSPPLAGARGRHVGLRGMAERARLVGGTLEVESVPGRGTTIYLAIPLREEPPDEGGAVG